MKLGHLVGFNVGLKLGLDVGWSEGSQEGNIDGFVLGDCVPPQKSSGSSITKNKKCLIFNFLSCNKKINTIFYKLKNSKNMY